MTGLDELALLHLRHGEAGVDLAHAVNRSIPPGWVIVTRKWGFRHWDALIQPPAGGRPGWRLADPFATSRRKAVRRAVAEIEGHLRDRRAHLAAQNDTEVS